MDPTAPSRQPSATSSSVKTLQLLNLVPSSSRQQQPDLTLNITSADDSGGAGAGAGGVAIGDGGMVITSASRKKVRVACLPCQKHKQKCDAQRPCSKCVARGKPEQCVDRSAHSIASVPLETSTSSQNKSHLSEEVKQVLISTVTAATKRRKKRKDSTQSEEMDDDCKTTGGSSSKSNSLFDEAGQTSLKKKPRKASSLVESGQRMSTSSTRSMLISGTDHSLAMLTNLQSIMKKWSLDRRVRPGLLAEQKVVHTFSKLWNERFSDEVVHFALQMPNKFSDEFFADFILNNPISWKYFLHSLEVIVGTDRMHQVRNSIITKAQSKVDRTQQLYLGAMGSLGGFEMKEKCFFLKDQISLRPEEEENIKRIFNVRSVSGSDVAITRTTYLDLDSFKYSLHCEVNNAMEELFGLAVEDFDRAVEMGKNVFTVPPQWWLFDKQHWVKIAEFMLGTLFRHPVSILDQMDVCTAHGASVPCFVYCFASYCDDLGGAREAVTFCMKPISLTFNPFHKLRIDGPQISDSVPQHSSIASVSSGQDEVMDQSQFAQRSSDQIELAQRSLFANFDSMLTTFPSQTDQILSNLLIDSGAQTSNSIAPDYSLNLFPEVFSPLGGLQAQTPTGQPFPNSALSPNYSIDINSLADGFGMNASTVSGDSRVHFENSS
eukprot:TRINITY_DN2348_c0_g1_i1.p1 TRINITY_DN2348_c0_g1~~TRINITY_DN2348_c0_g1_i1.p1  ORF type:complete len:661 (-),score=162.15 TRINITY_DN2348_c0_g1_i1:47-2029(-)